MTWLIKTLLTCGGRPSPHHVIHHLLLAEVDQTPSQCHLLSQTIIFLQLQHRHFFSLGLPVSDIRSLSLTCHPSLRIHRTNQTSRSTPVVPSVHRVIHQLGEFWLFENKSVKNKSICLNSKFVFKKPEFVSKKQICFVVLQIGQKQIC